MKLSLLVEPGYAALGDVRVLRAKGSAGLSRSRVVSESHEREVAKLTRQAGQAEAHRVERASFDELLDGL